MFKISAVCVALCCPAAAVAQDTGMTPLIGDMNEHYDSSPRVAGSRLVGIRLGASAALAFDPTDVRIVGPGAGHTVCVRSISRDGLYWMRNAYGRGGTSPERLLRLDPFTKDLGTRLEAYPEGDIAILAFVGTDEACLDEAAMILPTVVSRSVPERLEILMNSGNRALTARFEMADKVSEVRCEAPQGAERVAYDRLCSLEIQLGSQPIEGRLDISMDDGLSIRSERFVVLLPAKP